MRVLALSSAVCLALSPTDLLAENALLAYGAMLLKNVTRNLEDVAVEAWVEAGYDYPIGDYSRPNGKLNTGGTCMREQVRQGVYDVAAGNAASEPVLPHAESGYQTFLPRFVAFKCEIPAEVGGEVRLSSVMSVQELLPAAFIEQLRQRGVRYAKRLGDRELSPWWTYETGFWQDRYGTDDFERAVDLAWTDTGVGGQGGVRLARDLNGTVMQEWRASAFACLDAACESELLVTSILDYQISNGFAMGDLYSLRATWGDGEEFSEEEIDALRQATNAADYFEAKMEVGDVIVVDNFRFQHARAPYTGRRLHTSTISRAVHRGLDSPLQLSGVSA